MLEVRDVTKRFSGIPALSGVSFVAHPGEVTGYLGPNGSGKSTTVKIVTGLLEASEGEVLYNGENILNDLIEYKRKIGYVPEEPHLYSYLTGEEYLELTADLRGLPRDRVKPKIAEFLRLFGLYGDRYVRLSSYSKGMRQKVLLAAALLHNPELIVLDEPFSGLDVSSALVLRRLIPQLAAAGKVILYSSHVLEIVEKICARVVILHKGRVAAADSVTRLRGLMEAPSLEAVFSQLAVEQDVDGVANAMTELVLA
jgi:ABC-2 type transport system ATP-binding protein